MLLRFTFMLFALVMSVGAHAACSNADMTGEWAITKNGYYGGHSLCKIRFTNNKAKGSNNNCTYNDDNGSSRTFGFKASTRFTVNSACKITIKAANTLGANLSGLGYMSRDGNNMVGKVTNQNGIPMTINGVKLK